MWQTTPWEVAHGNGVRRGPTLLQVARWGVDGQYVPSEKAAVKRRDRDLRHGRQLALCTGPGAFSVHRSDIVCNRLLLLALVGDLSCHDSRFSGPRRPLVAWAA